MNYGRQGIHKQQVALNAHGRKWSHKLLLLLIEAVLVVVIGAGIIGAAFGIGMFKSILAAAPDISTITVAPKGRSSFVYDSDGKQIAKLVAANSNRIPVTSDQIPKVMKDAIVAIEDERFYTHNGIDIRRILSVGVRALRSGALGQGASTITQQLIKNNVFTDWINEDNDVQKVKRKLQEQYLAVQLEKTMSKDDILTVYLNTVNFGHNTLGVQTASLRYFGKNCSELTLSEAAVIAGITQNPSKFDPILRPKDNADRRKLVLDKMLEVGFITQSEYNEAKADDVYSRIEENNIIQANSGVTSYFVDALTEQVIDDLKDAGYNESQVNTLLYSGGLKIHSTMDSRIQAICDEEFANEENYPANTKWLLSYKLTILKADGSYENHSSEMFRTYFRQLSKKNKTFNMLYSSPEDAEEAIRQYQEAVLGEGDEIFLEDMTLTPQPQVSFTVEDQSTGHVVAMVGGRGVKEGSRTFNRATQSARQPGSCFKVLAAFAPALDSYGMTLATVFNDAPFNYYNGTPVTNWYGKDTYKGLCNIRYGIYYSLNVVAVKTITQITPELGFNYLLNFGISTLEEAKPVGNQIFTDIGQPLALGGLTNGVYNFELNAAYASIANRGIYIEPKLYTYIEDSDGNIILDNREPVSRRTVSEETAFLLTSAMEDCVKIGTGTRAKLKGMSVAGKTGTTSDSRDVWFAGFTPYYTATCWTGFDNNEILSDAESKTAQTMFKAVMTRVHEGLTDTGFSQPSTVVKKTICSKSGLLPIPGICDDCLKEEYFAKGTEPTTTCNVHFVGMICGYDNMPATAQCPFQYYGSTEVIPVEDPSLWAGSSVITDDFDPLAANQNRHTGFCQHDETFFARDNWQEILWQQQAEYDARVAAAQAAAEAAAAAGQ